ncbi:MAG: hypothetical protein [Circular genetic element sp.]|nr:MAG: hypothetical protein [Circular genetic element sp.]
MQCIKSWTLIYSTEMLVEVHCSHDLSSMISLSCLASTNTAAVLVLVLDFGTLLEFTRRGFLSKWLSVGDLASFLCIFSCHQKHTPLSWPRTRSLRPRRWTSITRAIISVRLSLMYERTRAAVAVFLTVVAVSASISSTLRIDTVVSTHGKVENDSEGSGNTSLRVDTD